MRFRAIVLVIILTNVTIVSAAPKRTLKIKRSIATRSRIKQPPLRSRGGYGTNIKPLSDQVVLDRARKKLGLRPQTHFPKIAAAAKFVDPYEKGVKLTPRRSVNKFREQPYAQVDFYGAIAENHSLTLKQQFYKDGILLGLNGHPHDWPQVVGDWIGVAQLAFKPAMNPNGWSNKGPYTCLFRIKLSPLDQEKITVYMDCKGSDRHFSDEMTRVAPGEYVAVVDLSGCREFSAHLSSLYGVVFYEASLRHIE